MSGPSIDDLIAAAAAEFHVDVMERLREGGQKVVALVRGADAKLAVLKVVALTTASRDDHYERAKREVGLLAQLADPNVVTLASELKEFGTGPDGVAWLEEYLDGTDLRDLLGVQWTWDEVASMASQVASGLAALHAKKVVHRDLSPSNIRRLTDGTYKILDPGYGRYLERTTITQLGQPGTPGYLSPEHIGTVGKPIESSDIFALGVLMYRALTGDLPFPVGADLDQYVNELRTGSAPPVGATRADLTPQQQAVVDTALQRQSARRYQSASELIEALEAL